MLNETINLEGKTVLVTGAAGFIGANLVRNLFKNIKGIQIIGLDNMNNYYDVGLKKYRLKNIEKQIVGMKDTKVDFHWRFIKGSISDKQLVNDIFQNYRPDIVVNLAAQAGVRYSLGSLYKPNYNSEYYYRFAYPFDIIISGGIHIQLTRRTGKTRAQLKKEAKQLVYETGTEYIDGKSR